MERWGKRKLVAMNDTSAEILDPRLIGYEDDDFDDPEVENPQTAEEKFETANRQQVVERIRSFYDESDEFDAFNNRLHLVRHIGPVGASEKQVLRRKVIELGGDPDELELSA